MEFNTVSISDGITMGSDGMRASLISRDGVSPIPSSSWPGAGNWFDGLVVLVGCDRHPRRRDGVARVDIPGLVLYGGSIAPGRWEGRDVTIQDVFEAVGHARGRQDDRRAR
ncbi:Dihydroxy-acid dehydratase [Geodia barretti]|uniref:Dihydroxy-acid dehydratase n=1 Tax=Geodia barretti TaxID=519541 RepID=A0AA35R9L3_GEOBA|nr:Dihydroxy-acid dehydratase [Geodia barretti]